MRSLQFCVSHWAVRALIAGKVLTPWSRVLLESLNLSRYFCFLWNLEINYRVHNRPPLTGSQMNPVLDLTPYFFKIYFHTVLLAHQARVPKVVSSVQVFRLKFCVHLSSPHARYMPLRCNSP
jgi:hypothetical protein